MPPRRTTCTRVPEGLAAACAGSENSSDGPATARTAAVAQQPLRNSRRSRSRRSWIELGMACSSAGQEFGRHQHKRHHRTQALLVVVPLEVVAGPAVGRSEEHTSELQSLMRISYAVFCLKKKKLKDKKTSRTTSSSTS